eukprot:TRINITY_DN8500_c0_g1_i1.p1 TRINITY_DN8500_c0_g1~~TRINITY_DN8500_c0_g1_i1.p1  ORF type:complete len:614 (+),score=171.02 TRINITY_DN8500_c0_g1_i1:66-1907(+)
MLSGYGRGGRVRRRPHQRGCMSGTPALPPPSGRDPPWLVHAGMPNDGSVSTGEEVEAFCNFVVPTRIERAQRAALRSVVQKLVQLHISPEATAKIVGSSSTGLDTYQSSLDLAVEIPAALEQDPLDCLRAGLSSVGIASTESAAATATGPVRVLRIPARGLQELSKAWAHADFDAVVRFCTCPPSSERAAAAAISGMLKRLPVARSVARVVHAVLRQSRLTDDAPGGFSSYAATLMVLAFVESKADTPLLRDAGLVLREFFRFFATFDWDSREVSPSNPTCPFPPKAPSGALCISDVVPPHHNVAAGVHSIQRLKATFYYITTCIQRYDRVGQRSLLANVVAHSSLGGRLEVLSGLDGGKPQGAVTKSVATELLREMRGLLGTPEVSTDAAIEDLVRDLRTLIAQPGHDSGVVDVGEQLGQRLKRFASLGRPHLVPFLADPRRVAESVYAFRDEPEVREQLERLVQDSMDAASHPGEAPQAASAGASSVLSKKDVVEMFQGIADFLEDPANSADIRAVGEELKRDQSEGQIDTKRKVMSRLVERRVAEKPESKMAAFRNQIPLLTDTVFEIAAEDPAVQEQLLRISTLDALWARCLHPVLQSPPRGDAAAPSA